QRPDVQKTTGDFGRAIRTIEPSLVYIRSLVIDDKADLQLSLPMRLSVVGTATGFIVDEDGHILTSAHVVGKGEKIIQALVLNKGYLDAKIVGVDREKEIVLIKVSAPPSWRLKQVKFSRRQLAINDRVMKGGFPGAVWTSNTPSFARGIVSNTRAFLRDYSTPFCATDTQMNPGDSGGPVFNNRGEVVGVASFTAFRGSPVGVTHFVSSEIILRVLSRLYHGDVRAGWLGINPGGCIDSQDINRDSIQRERVRVFLDQHKIEMPDVEHVHGAIIMEFLDASVGDARLLRVGDLITHVNGRPPRDKWELIQWISEAEPGSEIALRVIRGRTPMPIRLKVGEYKSKPAQAPAETQPNQ
ncbi:MAG: trypsin-like peptidase domain-containing protein, partial [bacterium]|nr:trypsin-like peptidase domain-containing protein [bacterium]